MDILEYNAIIDFLKDGKLPNSKIRKFNFQRKVENFYINDGGELRKVKNFLIKSLTFQ